MLNTPFVTAKADCRWKSYLFSPSPRQTLSKKRSDSKQLRVWPKRFQLLLFKPSDFWWPYPLHALWWQKEVQGLIPSSSLVPACLCAFCTLICPPSLLVGSRASWELVSETRLCPALSARLAISRTAAFQASQALSGSRHSTCAHLEPGEGGSHR